MMTVLRATPSAASSRYSRRATTWAPPGAEPRPFGPLGHPETVQGVAPRTCWTTGPCVACGIYVPKGFDPVSGGRSLYRPSDILIGHLARGADQFSWHRIATGTFLTEQLIAPGIALPDGGWYSPCADRTHAATTGSAGSSRTTSVGRSATGRSATNRIRRSARTRR